VTGFTILAMRAVHERAAWDEVATVMAQYIAQVCTRKTWTDPDHRRDLQQEVLLELPLVCSKVLAHMSDQDALTTVRDYIGSVADSKIWQLRDGMGRETHRKIKLGKALPAPERADHDVTTVGPWPNPEHVLDERRRLQAARDAAPAVRLALSDKRELGAAKRRWGTVLVEVMLEIDRD